MNDCRIIGFRRSNYGRTSDVYMVSECRKCRAILEFPSNKVKSEVVKTIYKEYIICPNCGNKVIIIDTSK